VGEFLGVLGEEGPRETFFFCGGISGEELKMSEWGLQEGERDKYDGVEKSTWGLIHLNTSRRAACTLGCVLL
jgi:hypothetical protein